MIVTYLMTFFDSCLNAKVTQIAFTNTKTMIFCLEFIQEVFAKIFEINTCFGN